MSPNFVKGLHKLLHNSSRVGPTTFNVIASGYVTFYRINELFVNILFFMIDKRTSWVGFGTRAVVWSRVAESEVKCPTRPFQNFRLLSIT